MSYILVAEDEPDATMLLQEAFGEVNPGLPVVYTCDGREAIDFLQGKSEPGRPPALPALLLVDLKMPRMDGFGVLKWLLERPALRPQKVVVLTCSALEEDIERAGILAADLYVIKPVKYADLQEIVRSMAQLALSGVWPAIPELARTFVVPLRGSCT